jgi:hypothetical protein
MSPIFLDMKEIYFQSANIVLSNFNPLLFTNLTQHEKRHDYQHNETQHNDAQHNNINCKGAQQNDT